MRLSYKRIAVAGVAAAGAVALSLTAGSPASASSLFSFSSYRSTAQSAVFEAVGMAQEAAREAGFFGECTIVRGPIVTEIRNDPYRGHTFNASVTLSCLP